MTTTKELVDFLVKCGVEFNVSDGVLRATSPGFENCCPLAAAARAAGFPNIADYEIVVPAEKLGFNETTEGEREASMIAGLADNWNGGGYSDIRQEMERLLEAES